MYKKTVFGTPLMCLIEENSACWKAIENATDPLQVRKIDDDTLDNVLPKQLQGLKDLRPLLRYAGGPGIPRDKRGMPDITWDSTSKFFAAAVHRVAIHFFAEAKKYKPHSTTDLVPAGILGPAISEGVCASIRQKVAKTGHMRIRDELLRGAVIDSLAWTAKYVQEPVVSIETIKHIRRSLPIQTVRERKVRIGHEGLRELERKQAKENERARKKARREEEVQKTDIRYDYGPD